MAEADATTYGDGIRASRNETEQASGRGEEWWWVLLHFITPEMHSEGHEGLPRLTNRKEGTSKPRDRAERPLILL